jgi:acetyltransferase-like isoleucine patch superfamily enzyme
MNRMSPSRTYIDHDWYPGGIPGNVVTGENVYLETSYGFAPCNSEEEAAIVLGNASGTYDQATFVLGPGARVVVGPYSVLKCHLVCERSIRIGAHCMLSWGAVVTDTWLEQDWPVEKRREYLEAVARHPHRSLGAMSTPGPVVLEDNVWVGFDSVIMPGVTIGRGSIIGSKTIVEKDVPAYSVVVGNPGRVAIRLEADDTEAARAEAFREYVHPRFESGNVRGR